MKEHDNNYLKKVFCMSPERYDHLLKPESYTINTETIEKPFMLVID